MWVTTFLKGESPYLGPNPIQVGQELLFVPSFGEEAEGHLTLFDVAGKAYSLSTQNRQVPVGLATGLYYLQIRVGNRQWIENVLITQ